MYPTYSQQVFKLQSELVIDNIKNSSYKGMTLQRSSRSVIFIGSKEV